MKIGRFETNNIYNEDCYKAIKDIPDNSIDLVITDPPYEFAAHGGGAFGNKNREYHNELEEANITRGINKNLLNEYMRVMKKVNIYIWCNKEQIYEYLDYFKEYNLEILTWHKTNPVPTCNNKYLSDTEYLLFFREKGVKVYGEYETKKKWYVTELNKNDKDLYKHPTIKPLNIIKNLIINSSEKEDLILDTFLGSGTTAVACKETSRQFLGFEIDKDYFKIAQDRIKGITKTGQTSLDLFTQERMDVE